MFLLTFTILNTANSLQKLENTVLQAKGLRRSTTASSCSWTSSRRTRVPAPAGNEQNRDTARPNYVEPRYFCAFTTQEAIPARGRRALLRRERAQRGT